MTNILLGFLVGHLAMNVYSAISGNMPSSIIPGLDFTPKLNAFELAIGLILIFILTGYLFFRRKAGEHQSKYVLRMLNGTLFFGAMFAFSETNWLLLGTCLTLALFFFYINFFRLKT